MPSRPGRTPVSGNEPRPQRWGGGRANPVPPHPTGGGGGGYHRPPRVPPPSRVPTGGHGGVGLTSFAVPPATSVELEGVEPSSKQGTRRLSTCLSVISSFSPYPAYGSPIRSPVRKISPRTPGHAPQPASHCRYPDASRTRSGSCRRGTRPRTSLGTGIKVMLLSKITQRVHSYYCHLYV